MNANDKKRNIAEGLWLDASLFYGTANDATRAAMKAAGASFDSGSRKWVFPTLEAMRPFKPNTLPNLESVVVPESPNKAPATQSEPATPPMPAAKAIESPKTSETTKTSQAKPILKSLPPADIPMPAFPRPAPRFPKPAIVPAPKPIKQALKASALSEETSVSNPPASSPPASSSAANPPSAAAKPELEVNGKSVQVGTWSRAGLMRLPAALLVTLSVQIKGAIEYFTEDESREYLDTDGTITTKIRKTTQRIVKDEKEHKKTKAVTNAMRYKVRNLGIVMQPGVIRVRKARQAELDKAMDQIEAEALAHNSEAKYHFIRLLISYEETSEESVKYAQQFAYLLQEGMDNLRLAIDACDVKKIREEASAFKKLAEGTKSADGALILKSVEEARKIAKFVDQEVNRKSRQISDVKQRINTEAIDSIRMKFLQYEVPPAMEAARQSIEKGRFANLEAPEMKPMAVNGGIEPGRFGNGS